MPSRKRHRVWRSFSTLAVIIAALGVVALGITQLFRAEVEQSQVLGELTYYHQWGKRARLEVDVNRDGLVDGIYRLPAMDSAHSIHTRYTEGWESSLCDGELDLHWYYDDDEVLVAEYDENKDGILERVATGEQAIVSVRSRAIRLGCWPVWEAN